MGTNTLKLGQVIRVKSKDKWGTISLDDYPDDFERLFGTNVTIRAIDDDKIYVTDAQGLDVEEYFCLKELEPVISDWDE